MMYLSTFLSFTGGEAGKHELLHSMISILIEAQIDIVLIAENKPLHTDV